MPVRSSLCRQRAGVGAATLLANAAAVIVLVLLPGHLVLDLRLTPAAYGALAGVAAAVFALATPVGRYLTLVTPGRTAIVTPAAVAAVLTPGLLLRSSAAAPLAGALGLGVAAVGLGLPAWRALVEASAATGVARSAARCGQVTGLAAALAATTCTDGLVRGIEIGSGVGLVGVVVLFVAVEDRRAPLAPRRSATLPRCRRVLEVPAVRTTTGVGAWAALSVVSCTVALVAALGPGSDPAVLASALTLGGFCYNGAQRALGARAALAVPDDLARSARAVVEHAAVVSAATAAIATGLCVQLLP